MRATVNSPSASCWRAASTASRRCRWRRCLVVHRVDDSLPPVVDLVAQDAAAGGLVEVGQRRQKALRDRVFLGAAEERLAQPGQQFAGAGMAGQLRGRENRQREIELPGLQGVFGGLETG
ncbi:MAG: hypothetical protein U1A27_13815 [Phycisphaerae bacterium]